MARPIGVDVSNFSVEETNSTLYCWNSSIMVAKSRMERLIRSSLRSFKKELVRQFYAMREILWKQQYERKTESWQTARLEGKKARRLETNEIKLFVEYAAANGSKQPQWYYTAFTKLAHTAVGITSYNKICRRFIVSLLSSLCNTSRL